MNRTNKNEKNRKPHVGDPKIDETYRVDGEKHAAMDKKGPSKVSDRASHAEIDVKQPDRSGGPKTSPANKPQDHRRS